MSFHRSLSCPSCGVAVEEVTAHTRSLQCPHCDNWVYLGNNGWVASGGFEHALDAPSILYVGRSGSLNSRDFVVAGRIRLGYGSGNWDEWWLEFEDGDHQWLEEDDGSYQLHTSVEQQASAASLRSCSVGTFVKIEGQSFFVTEKNEAQVEGAQGALPMTIMPGEAVLCVEVVGGGKEYSLEISADDVSMTDSIPIDADSFRWK